MKIKKWVLIVFMLLLIIPTVYALFKVTEFNKAENKVIVSDWFGIDDLYSVQMIGHTPECFDCHTDYKVCNLENQDMALSDLMFKFYGRNSKEMIFNSQIQLYGEGKYFIDIRDYEPCIKLKEIRANKTGKTVFLEYDDYCLIGTHKEVRYDPGWGSVNINDLEPLKPQECQEIRVKGFLNPNSAIDNRLNLKGVEIEEFAWWNNSWAYSKPIAYNFASNETLYNFTVPIVIDHASLVTAGKSQADGDDIRFLSSDNSTEYLFSVDGNNSASWGWNKSTTTVWVLVSEWTGGVDLGIHMYYGNTDALNGQVFISDVWDADTAYVYTFSNVSGANVIDVIDNRTGVGTSLVWNNSAETNKTSGSVDLGTHSQGRYITVDDDSLDWLNGAFTLDSWQTHGFGAPGASVEHALYWVLSGSSHRLFFINGGGDNRTVWGSYDNSNVPKKTGAMVEADFFKWKYIGWYRGSGEGGCVWYSTDVLCAGADADVSKTSDGCIGCRPSNANNYWWGQVAFFRASTVERTENWLATNERIHDYTLGSEEELIPPIASDLLFANSTGVYKTTFDEGEEFRGWINLTTNIPINDSNCTMSFENGISETNFVDTNFSLCGASCDFEKLLFNISDLPTANAIHDEIRVSACIYALGARDVTVNTTCSDGSFIVQGNGSQSPLCEDGLADFVFNTTVCVNDTDIQIEILNSDPFNLRFQVLGLEYDRTYSNFTQNMTFNFTLDLYQNGNTEYYTHGNKTVTSECVNVDSSLNINDSETLTIVNVAPRIFHTIINVSDVGVFSFANGTSINASNLSIVTFFTAIIDDDLVNSSHLLVCDNGVIINQTHQTEMDLHVINGTQLITGNCNFTTFAIDVLSANTTEISTIEVNKFIPVPVIVSVDITPASPTTNDRLNCSARATDPLRDNLNISFEWFEDGVLNVSYNTSISTTNNTLVYTTILVNSSVADWTCRVRAFNGLVYSLYSNTSVSVTTPPPPIISCNYDPTPYIKILDRIEWLCLIEEQQETTNPDTAIIDCNYDPTPYIKTLENIEWLCSINKTG